jgi:hypothetical protein
VLLGGQPVAPGLVLLLEDQAFNQVATTVVGTGGVYRFRDVPPSPAGYNITFTWERNQGYSLDEVIAWGWIGPVAYDGQSALRLPDLEIALLGLGDITPEPDSTYSAAAIAPGTPLTFNWGSHPLAGEYWVDLLAGDSLERVWHTPTATETAATLEGQLDDSTRIEPGAYWWAAGGRGTVEGYGVTVYGQLAGLTITP